MNGVFHAGEVYQVSGGQRLCVISVTPDPEVNDTILVLQDEGGAHTFPTVSEFFAQRPELITNH